MTLLLDLALLLCALLFGLCAAWAGLYGAHSAFMTLRARRRPEATPERDLFGEYPPEEIPAVTVQIPICNEGELAYQALRSVVAVKYPQDRLQIQLCDDSSDEATSALVAAFAAQYAEQGFDIHHLQRQPREGFKPGNLNHANQYATGEYIAIVDADFQIPGEFFQRNLPFFLDDPQLAAVQSYWTHANRDHNILNQAIEASYDLHLLVEQLTWSNWQTWMQFNGSGGIWRRAVLDEMGGWPVGNGIEDVYMSYLVQPKGWRIRFSTATTCIGQLPESLERYRSQQGRWALCCGEIVRHLLWPLMRTDAPWDSREQALFKLCGYVTHTSLTGLMLFSWPTLLWLQRHPSFQWLMWPLLALMALLIAGNGMAASESSQRAGRGFWQTQWSNTLLGFLQTGIAPNLATRFLKGLMGARLRHWLPSNEKARKARLPLADIAFELSLVASVAAALWVGLSSGWLWILCVPVVFYVLGVLFILMVPAIVWIESKLRAHPKPLPAAPQKRYIPPAL